MFRDEKIPYFLFASISVIYILSWTMACSRGLTSTLEGESAQTAREFLHALDWTVNHLNGVEDYDKPAFFYWIIAFFSLLTGGVSELSARIPSLLSTLIIISLFSRYYDNNPHQRHLFLMAAAIFITSPKVFWMSQIGRMDMTLNMFCFSAITAFGLYWRERDNCRAQKIYYYVFFVATALAVLTKGPVGFIITGVPVFIFLAIKREKQELLHFFLGKGIVLFLIISLPWFINACIQTEGAFFNRFFLEENLSRFGNLFSAIEFKEFNRSPFNRYFVYLLGGFFPWSILLPGFLFALIRRTYRPDDSDLIIITYILWIFCFFSLSGVKRSDYILPLYPAASLMVARYLFQNFSLKGITKFAFSLAAFFSISVMITGSVPIILSTTKGLSLASQYIPKALSQELIRYAEHPETVVPFAVFSLIIILTLPFLAMRNKSFNVMFASITGILAAFYVYAVVAIFPVIYANKDMRPYCKEISILIGTDQVYSYRFWDEEIVFYLNRFINKIDAEELRRLMNQKEQRIFLLVREENLEELQIKTSGIPFVYNKKMPAWRRIYLISNRPF